MTKTRPFIKCTDLWPGRIPPEKLAAYKQLIEEGQILKHQVLHNRSSGVTIIEYSSTVPHEWILEEMKKRSEEVKCNA